MFIYDAADTRFAKIADILAPMAPHMRPILTAARDGGIDLLAIDQHSGPAVHPGFGKPLITIIEDDPPPGKSLGIAAFHRRSIRKLVRRCKLVVVNAWAPDPFLYNLALAYATGLQSDVMFIETRRIHEQEWTSAIEAFHPDVNLIASNGCGEQK
jgi:hypothetical protein